MTFSDEPYEAEMEKHLEHKQRGKEFDEGCGICDAKEIARKRGIK